jgi:putative membrane protein
MLGIVLRLACSALAVWLATLIIPGIEVTAETGWGTAGTIILIALIFGVVNAVIKPVVKVIGCGLYVLTLGLIGLVVNALLFWLTGWIARQFDIPFEVNGFWAAFFGALLVGVVSWVLGLVVKDRGED